MTVYIGLLRAVNLGGSTQLRMPALRDLMTRKGYGAVQTLLQYGNVVFHHDARSPMQLEHTLERALSAELGLSTDFFIRTASEWRALLEGNPFAREAVQDPAHLVVTVLKRTPKPQQWAALRAAIRGRERIEGADRHAYIVYPDGIGRSKLTAAVIERNLSARCTSRNWNTACKLAQLASS
jgi:uncharacterized protein (DUF1697 family)